MFEDNLRDVDQWKMLKNHGKGYDLPSCLLYHYYHFNYKMKKASEEIELFTVTRPLINAVCSVQEKMMYEIADRGIAVECNPSSNFLIGTFKNYRNHPIFRFYNRDLFSPGDKRYSASNPRISASINTDDLGIFDTSLESEYALMASALAMNNDLCEEDERISDGNIYLWLDHIRENGINQRFG